jgi:LPXTG-motif cell wall-anchored protein
MKSTCFQKFQKILVLLLILSGIIAFGTWPALWSEQHQVSAQIQIYTPTPGSDGRIIYVVKQGDTLTSISIIMGVTIDELRKLNNLTDDNIFEGQKLLLGLAGPPQVEITPGPTPTPTPLLPTPSPKPGSGILCILLFNDINGDSLRQEDTEPSIPEGAISVTNRSGSVNLTQPTLAGTEPFCFENLPEGEYTIGVAVPAGYNPTTELSYILKLGGGDETYIDFGAQMKVAQEPGEIADPVTGEQKTPLLAIIGGAFLVISLGLLFLSRKALKPK